jgi:methionine aminopeptidase
MMAHVESGHNVNVHHQIGYSPQEAAKAHACPTTRSGVTVDKSLAVYWEHVVAVTDTGCEVLDLREDEDVTFYDHP